MEKELYNFWKNVDIGELLEFNPKYTESVNNKNKFKELIYGIEQLTIIVKNRYQLESDDLKQVDKEEDKELQRIKKELNTVESLKNVLWSVKK